jgi:hypothetical protein
MREQSSAGFFGSDVLTSTDSPIRVGRQDRREAQTQSDAQRHPQHQRAKRWDDPALNQGRDPWCWAFSPTSAATLARASAGSPYKHLSGNAVGNMVTGFKVRGGWSENSMKFIQEKGVPETRTGQRATINGIGTAPTPGRTQRKTSSVNGGTSIPATPLRS